MKRWMKWLIAVSVLMVVLSGITIVFATNNETTETIEVQEDSIYINPKPYKIHAGDSLWKLTADYSGSLGRQELILMIMEYNHIEDPGKLKVNHVIYLPDCLSLND